jgi:DNA-binding transcriptional LysR family regulator
MVDELKRFLLVVKEGNLTRTAEKIFITQSALTQSIHRLEKELHTKLFIQKGKQLQLTEDGKSLVIIGERIIQLWESAHDPQIRKTQIPTYAIGMFDNIALRLGKFFQENMLTNQYKLELTIDSSGRLLTQLQLGTLDAAICILNKNYRPTSQITLLQTYSERLLPVSAKQFSGNLDTIPFILYNKGSHTRAQIDESFAEQNIRPMIAAESTSVTFMRELAILGSGVALLPENFVKQDIDEGRLTIQKLPVQWKRTYALYINNTGLLSPTHPLTIAFQKELKKLTE